MTTLITTFIELMQKYIYNTGFLSLFQIITRKNQCKINTRINKTQCYRWSSLEDLKIPFDSRQCELAGDSVN